MFSKIMWWLVALLLTAVLVYVVATNKPPPILTQVKERYAKLRAHLATLDDPRWKPILKPAIITGMVDWDKSKGPIGYNVNKGYEIGICLRGDDANSAFYVLLHELAHTTVSEYDHSTNFWKNLKDLKAIAVAQGLYEAKGTTTYCGEVFTL
jgi:hypothetical protein